MSYLNLTIDFLQPERPCNPFGLAGFFASLPDSIRHEQKPSVRTFADINDIRSLSDTEVVSLTVSYLKTQDVFRYVNEGYLYSLLSQHLDSTQQNVMDESWELNIEIISANLFYICQYFFNIFFRICFWVFLFFLGIYHRLTFNIWVCDSLQ